MLLLETAFKIVNGQIDTTHEDVVEAFQFLNDSGYADRLDSRQRQILDDLVAKGLVETDAWHI